MSKTPQQPGELRPVPGPAIPRAPSRAARLFLWIFSIAMVVTAGTAFVFKLIEFIFTATSAGEASLASFLIPVLNYLFVAAGFSLLFVWSFLRGQFRDVEAPKFRMLERNMEIDRQWESELARKGGHR